MGSGPMTCGLKANAETFFFFFAYKHLFLTVVKVGESETWLPADLMWWLMKTASHWAFSWWKGWGALWGLFLKRH